MIKSKIFILMFIAMIIVTFTGCEIGNKGIKQEGKEENEAISGKIIIVDSYDREVVLDKIPERIISVGPNITEIIYELGAGSKLVGRTDYCDYPKEALLIDSIGGIEDPNIEKIASLKPDLVIGSTHFKQEIIDKLEMLKIKVVILYSEESFEGVYENINNVAKVLGKEKEAKSIIDGMKKNVKNVLEKIEGLEKPSVYFVIGVGEYGDYTAGGGTFIGSLVEMAGAVNVASDVDGWKYSLEKLIEHDPDILICSDNYSPKSIVVKLNGYKDLTAVKTGKIYDIDSNIVQRQGPRLDEALLEMAKLIHPDAF